MRAGRSATGLREDKGAAEGADSGAKDKDALSKEKMLLKMLPIMAPLTSIQGQD